MKATERVMQVLVAGALILLAALVAFLAAGLYFAPKDTGPTYIVIPPFTATATPFGFVTATPDVSPTHTPTPRPATRTAGPFRPATLTPGTPIATGTAVPAPSVSVVYPTAGLSVPAGQPIVIQASVFAAAGLVHTDIWMDGALYVSVINPVYGGTSMTVTQSWVSSAAGAHTLTLLAYDRLNQVSPAATVSFQLTSPVTISAWIAQPASTNGQVVFQAGDTIQLSYWGSAVNGVSLLELWIDGQRANSNTNFSHSTTMNVQQTWSSNTVGEHTLFVRVYDTLNETADSAPLLIGLTDRNPPNVMLVSPENGAQLAAGQTVQVMASANDSKGITSIQLWIDNALYSTWNSSSTAGQTTVNASLAWTQPAVGNHTLYLVARDSVGLSTTTSSITVSVLAASTATASPTPTATQTKPAATSTPTPTATRTASPTVTLT